MDDHTAKTIAYCIVFTIIGAGLMGYALMQFG